MKIAVTVIVDVEPFAGETRDCGEAARAAVWQAVHEERFGHGRFKTTPLDAFVKQLYRVTYTWKDGGSTWYVRALNKTDAIDAVREHFNELGSDSPGTFQASVENDEPGKVFGR